MKDHPKGFAIMPIIVIVLLVGVAGYLAYQNYQVKQDESKITESTDAAESTPYPPTLTPDSSHNWKTYTDNVAGFKIDYPANWSYEVFYPTSIPSKDQFDIEQYYGDVRFHGDNGSMRLSFGNLPDGGTRCGSEGGVFSKGTIENMSIGGQDYGLCKVESAWFYEPSEDKYEWLNCGNCGAIEKDGVKYIFELGSDNKDISDTIIPQILSTFQFTE
ncbi:hypothetical protein ACFL2C_03330 [Patescibacteria group bacterium]